MKTTADFIKEFESCGALLGHKRTFKEYVSEITEFQKTVCQMITGDDYHEGMRFSEALYNLEAQARQKELRAHPAIKNAIITMKKLEKEMAITISGANGEELVFKTLDFLARPDTKVFRNVYITDGENETELDGIVLTDNGIIILEIKKIKTDIVLTDDGRLLYNGEESFDKVPLGQKMTHKRRLLKKCLEKAIADKGLDIPVWIDSIIVFSAPKGQYIKIDDRYRREKHCFRTSLNKRIEAYTGGVSYRDERFEQLNEIFSEMASNVKRFESELNYDDVRRSLAEALVVLQDEPVNNEERSIAHRPIRRKTKSIDIYKHHKKAPQKTINSKALNLSYVVVSMFAGVLIPSVIATIGTNIYQRAR